MTVPIVRRRIEIDYTPRREFAAFHDRVQRWAIIVAHRRAGKTVATINDTIKRAIQEAKPDGRYAFLAPLYNQAKDIAWGYLKRYAGPLLAAPPSEAELRVELINGARIRLYGADNPDRLRGMYLDGVVLDEFADMAPAVWNEVVRPALSDRKGWAIFIGTPKGKNAFWELWTAALKDPAWFYLMLKASETGIIPASELAELRIQMGDDRYAQEEECSFEAAIKGAFFAEELRAMQAEGRITPIAVDKAARVHTAWDLGVSDSTAIWFIQCVGRERRLIDYHEASGVGLDAYVQILHDKRRQHGYQYGEHWFPHDIAHRELSTGLSRIDTLRGLGIEPSLVTQHNVLDGINAVRRMLGRTWINPDRFSVAVTNTDDTGRAMAHRGLEALRQYRREWDERLKDWKSNPLHNWASHGADALRTFAAGFDDPLGVKPFKPRTERRAGLQGQRTAWTA